uniref:MSP domain-containing protein n=1 Tax=Schistocephalus solidus TaxID=70667 RepID=A0A183SRI9_SCHSO
LPYQLSIKGDLPTMVITGEVVTKNTDSELLLRLRNRNECILNPFTMINKRESLVPVVTLPPAPIAYVKFAAVKKVVVGSRYDCRLQVFG